MCGGTDAFQSTPMEVASQKFYSWESFDCTRGGATNPTPIPNPTRCSATPSPSPNPSSATSSLSPTPNPICAWPRGRITKIASGNRHNLVINAASRLFVWGCNRNGQQGAGSVTTVELSPSQIMCDIDEVVRGGGVSTAWLLWVEACGHGGMGQTDN